MIKYILIFFLSVQYCFAQFNFDKKAYETVNKWVVFEPNSTNPEYIYGYVYRDPTAGFTFKYESSFSIDESNSFKKKPADMSSVRVRLRPNLPKVAILSEAQIKQLELPTEPDWLQYYQESNVTDSVSYLTSLGLHYNAAGGSSEGLKYLEKAYTINPHAKGLEFELAFAYNALHNYEKAIVILNKAIQNDPKNFWFYRELGFSYAYQNKIEEAEKTYLKGIELSNQKPQKAEMAINMIQAYYRERNKEKFEQWVDILKEHAPSDSPFLQYIDQFRSTWDNPTNN